MSRKTLVYVVDDEPEIRETLRNVFEFSGFEVQCFADANAFLGSTIRSINSCIVLDLRLPEMSGLELQSRLRQLDLNLPIVIYTGNADVGTTVKALGDGAFTLLQKPASNDELIKTVKNAVEHSDKENTQRVQIENAHEHLRSLSDREREIAELLADGYRAAEVAQSLTISARTVETHRTHIFRKLNIKSVATLAKLVVLSDL
ncbi:DNA-binding response regulator [Aliidiomarina sedimenti]|uniref:DNA-binding response regulator n=1 Tax=Aliidiomarina sedimenti TaxID=1933879 RepID=A0ABY0C232_9GAMM|nr:response regulator [Aliidiomarina sedimenti]RUO31917.1 DNA-binding response regulator [Aliidiomarina sedimenti]